MFKLEEVEVPAREHLLHLYSAVSNACLEPTIQGVVDHLASEGIAVSQEEVSPFLERYEDHFLGALGLFAHMARKFGYSVFTLYRAVAVIVPAVVWKTYERGSPLKEPAVAVLVFGDPDSGRLDWNEVVLTGYRFGLDDIILDGRTVRTIHGDVDDSIGLFLDELKLLATSEIVDDKRRVKALDCIKELEEIFSPTKDQGEFSVSKF